MSGKVRPAIASTLTLLILGLLGLILSSYFQYIGSQFFIYVVATLGLYIVYGRTGQLTFAHAAFMGIGAYVTAIAASQLGMGAGITLLLAVAVASLVGVILAAPTLQFAHLRYAIITILFGDLFIWTITHTTSVSGGSLGIYVPAIEVGPFSTSEPLVAYYFCLLLATLITLITIRIAHSQFGLRMLAVRDSNFAAASMGISISKVKILSAVIASAYAGIAGWALAYTSSVVSPTQFGLFPSSYFLAAVVIGGARSIVGAWLGAAYITLAPELFTALGLPNLYPLVAGGLIVVMILAMPDGVIGFAQKVRGFVGSSRLVGVK